MDNPPDFDSLLAAFDEDVGIFPHTPATPGDPYQGVSLQTPCVPVPSLAGQSGTYRPHSSYHGQRSLSSGPVPAAHSPRSGRPGQHSTSNGVAAAAPPAATRAVCDTAGPTTDTSSNRPGGRNSSNGADESGESSSDRSPSYSPCDSYCDPDRVSSYRSSVDGSPESGDIESASGSGGTSSPPLLEILAADFGEDTKALDPDYYLRADPRFKAYFYGMDEISPTTSEDIDELLVLLSPQSVNRASERQLADTAASALRAPSPVFWSAFDSRYPHLAPANQSNSDPPCPETSTASAQILHTNSPTPPTSTSPAPIPSPTRPPACLPSPAPISSPVQPPALLPLIFSPITPVEFIQPQSPPSPPQAPSPPAHSSSSCSPSHLAPSPLSSSPLSSPPQLSPAPVSPPSSPPPLSPGELAPSPDPPRHSISSQPQSCPVPSLGRSADFRREVAAPRVRGAGFRYVYRLSTSVAIPSPPREEVELIKHLPGSYAKLWLHDPDGFSPLPEELKRAGRQNMRSFLLTLPDTHRCSAYWDCLATEALLREILPPPHTSSPQKCPRIIELPREPPLLDGDYKPFDWDVECNYAPPLPDFPEPICELSKDWVGCKIWLFSHCSRLVLSVLDDALHSESHENVLGSRGCGWGPRSECPVPPPGMVTLPSCVWEAAARLPTPALQIPKYAYIISAFLRFLGLRVTPEFVFKVPRLSYRLLDRLRCLRRVQYMAYILTQDFSYQLQAAQGLPCFPACAPPPGAGTPLDEDWYGIPATRCPTIPDRLRHCGQFYSDNYCPVLTEITWVDGRDGSTNPWTGLAWKDFKCLHYRYLFYNVRKGFVMAPENYLTENSVIPGCEVTFEMPQPSTTLPPALSAAIREARVELRNRNNIQTGDGSESGEHRDSKVSYAFMVQQLAIAMVELGFPAYGPAIEKRVRPLYKALCDWRAAVTLAARRRFQQLRCNANMDDDGQPMFPPLPVPDWNNPSTDWRPSPPRSGPKKDFCGDLPAPLTSGPRLTTPSSGRMSELPHTTSSPRSSPRPRGPETSPSNEHIIISPPRNPPSNTTHRNVGHVSRSPSSSSSSSSSSSPSSSSLIVPSSPSSSRSPSPSPPRPRADCSSRPRRGRGSNRGGRSGPQSKGRKTSPRTRKLEDEDYLPQETANRRGGGRPRGRPPKSGRAVQRNDIQVTSSSGLADTSPYDLCGSVWWEVPLPPPGRCWFGGLGGHRQALTDSPEIVEAIHRFNTSHGPVPVYVEEMKDYAKQYDALVNSLFHKSMKVNPLNWMHHGKLSPADAALNHIYVQKFQSSYDSPGAAVTGTVNRCIPHIAGAMKERKLLWAFPHIAASIAMTRRYCKDQKTFLFRSLKKAYASMAFPDNSSETEKGISSKPSTSPSVLITTSTQTTAPPHAPKIDVTAIHGRVYQSVVDLSRCLADGSLDDPEFSFAGCTRPDCLVEEFDAARPLEELADACVLACDSVVAALLCGPDGPHRVAKMLSFYDSRITPHVPDLQQWEKCRILLVSWYHELSDLRAAVYGAYGNTPTSQHLDERALAARVVSLIAETIGPLVRQDPDRAWVRMGSRDITSLLLRDWRGTNDGDPGLVKAKHLRRTAELLNDGRSSKGTYGVFAPPRRPDQLFRGPGRPRRSTSSSQSASDKSPIKSTHRHTSDPIPISTPRPERDPAGTPHENTVSGPVQPAANGHSCSSTPTPAKKGNKTSSDTISLKDPTKTRIKASAKAQTDETLPETSTAHPSAMDQSSSLERKNLYTGPAVSSKERRRSAQSSTPSDIGGVSRKRKSAPEQYKQGLQTPLPMPEPSVGQTLLDPTTTTHDILSSSLPNRSCSSSPSPSKRPYHPSCYSPTDIMTGALVGPRGRRDRAAFRQFPVGTVIGQTPPQSVLNAYCPNGAFVELVEFARIPEPWQEVLRYSPEAMADIARVANALPGKYNSNEIITSAASEAFHTATSKLRARTAWMRYQQESPDDVSIVVLYSPLPGEHLFCVPAPDTPPGGLKFDNKRGGLSFLLAAFSNRLCLPKSSAWAGRWKAAPDISPLTRMGVLFLSTEDLGYQGAVEYLQRQCMKRKKKLIIMDTVEDRYRLPNGPCIIEEATRYMKCIISPRSQCCVRWPSLLDFGTTIITSRDVVGPLTLMDLEQYYYCEIGIEDSTINLCCTGNVRYTVETRLEDVSCVPTTPLFYFAAVKHVRPDFLCGETYSNRAARKWGLCAPLRPIYVIESKMNAIVSPSFLHPTARNLCRSVILPPDPEARPVVVHIPEGTCSALAEDMVASIRSSCITWGQHEEGGPETTAQENSDIRAMKVRPPTKPPYMSPLNIGNRDTTFTD